MNFEDGSRKGLEPEVKQLVGKPQMAGGVSNYIQLRISGKSILETDGCLLLKNICVIWDVRYDTIWSSPPVDFERYHQVRAEQAI